MNIHELRNKINEISQDKFKCDIFCRSRKKEYIRQRQAVMYAVKELTDLELRQIAYVCSSDNVWNHATVINAIRKVRQENYLEWRKNDVAFWLKEIDFFLRNEELENNLFKEEVNIFFEKWTKIMTGKDLQILKQLKKNIMKQPQTSMDAYKSQTAGKLRNDYKRILETLKAIQPANYEKIYMHSTLSEPNSVSRRLKEMENLGLIEKTGSKSETTRGRMAFDYQIVKK